MTRLNKDGYTVVTCPKCNKEITGKWSFREHLMRVHDMTKAAATQLRNKIVAAGKSLKKAA